MGVSRHGDYIDTTLDDFGVPSTNPPAAHTLVDGKLRRVQPSHDPRALLRTGFLVLCSLMLMLRHTTLFFPYQPQV